MLSTKGMAPTFPLEAMLALAICLMTPFAAILNRTDSSCPKLFTESIFPSRVSKPTFKLVILVAFRLAIVKLLELLLNSFSRSRFDLIPGMVATLTVVSITGISKSKVSVMRISCWIFSSILLHAAHARIRKSKAIFRDLFFMMLQGSVYLLKSLNLSFIWHLRTSKLYFVFVVNFLFFNYLVEG